MTDTPPPRSGSSALYSVVPRLIPLTITSFLGMLAVGIPLPVLPVRVHDGLEFGAVIVGAVVGSQSLVTVLTRGSMGAAVDIRGAKWAVIAGLPLAALAGLAYLASLAVATPTLSLMVLLSGRMVLGIAESLFITGLLSWGMGRVGLAKAGLVMGWNGIAVMAAWAVGAPIGVFMQDQFGFAAVAGLAILCPLLGLMIALAVPGVPVAVKGSEPRMAFFQVVRVIWRHGLVLSLSTAPLALLGSFVVLTFAARGWPGAGLALSLYGVGFVLARLVFSHTPDRYGGAIVSIISLVIEGVGQALLWCAPQVEFALLGAFLTGLGFSLVFPAMGVDAIRLVPRGSQGVAIGTFTAFMDVALGITGPLIGLVVARAGFSSAFLAGTFACIAGLAMVFALQRSHRRV